jgi:hypothetical protein
MTRHGLLLAAVVMFVAAVLVAIAVGFSLRLTEPPAERADSVSAILH